MLLTFGTLSSYSGHLKMLGLSWKIVRFVTLISLQASGKGYRNKSDLRGQEGDAATEASAEKKIKKKPMLRPEYNPLMGDTSGPTSSFRRRDVAGAGGGGWG